jgi:hypothetical protein
MARDRLGALDGPRRAIDLLARRRIGRSEAEGEEVRREQHRRAPLGRCLRRPGEQALERRSKVRARRRRSHQLREVDLERRRHAPLELRLPRFFSLEDDELVSGQAPAGREQPHAGERDDREGRLHRISFT